MTVDSLEPGKQLMFRGKACSVASMNNETGVVWLRSEPKNEGLTYVCSIAIVMQEAVPMCSDFIPKHTKTEVDARIDELRRMIENVEEFDKAIKVHGFGFFNGLRQIKINMENRIKQLEKERGHVTDDIFSAIVDSHKVLCKIKQMGEKEAYGQDPAFYYGSAVAGEAGEMLNKMVKAFRNGGDASEGLRAAVLSELPDIVIYSFVLAYVLDMNLTQLVSEKAHVVMERAQDGYYGGPLVRSMKNT